MFNGQTDLVPPVTEFTGMYLAEVVDDVDPAIGDSGRVRVRVFPMMVRLEEAVLPWAVPAFPLFAGAGPEQGSYVVPSVGSRVWVFFAAGDVRSPVYFANAPGATDGPGGREPGVMMWKSKAGHVIEISDVDGDESIKITHMDGTTSIEMDKDGKVTIDAGDAITVNASDKVEVIASGDVEITSGSVVKIDPKCEVAPASVPLGKCVTDKTLPNCFYSGAPMPGTPNLQVG